MFAWFREIYGKGTGLMQKDTTDKLWAAVSFLILHHIGRKGVLLMQQSFTYEARGHMLVIHLPKELDHHNCRNLKYETDLLLSENYISKVVFDFSKTEFMDSSGIGILLNRYKQMAANGGKVALCGVNAQVGRILSIGGVARLIKNYETKEAALAGAGWNEP